ncbi:MAG: oligosaccharide repeat unit polymerase [Steroidobacteraceae bacterium]
MIYAACLLMFGVYCAGYFICSLRFNLKLKSQPTIVIANGHQQFSVFKKWCLFLLVALSVAYSVYLAGLGSLLASLLSFAMGNGDGQAVLEQRLHYSTGDQGWLAPGYVKQLRDILLPLVALILLFTIRRKTATFLLTSAIVLATVVPLLLASGQRGPLVLFALGMSYAAIGANRNRVVSTKAIFALVVVSLFVISTAFILVTRSFASRGYDDSTVGVLLLDRIVTRLPEENIDSAGVWLRGATFPGAGWVSDLASVMPGTQEGLSNELHAELGGGARGNSVLGLWIDVFYNFGWALCCPVALALGFSVALFNHWVNTQRIKSEIAEICGLWISTTMLMVLSPFGFLLYGPFLVSATLFVVARFSRPRLCLVRRPTSVLPSLTTGENPTPIKLVR